MAKVNYNGKTVSDEQIKLALQAIATILKKDVNVTSGDRDFVPAGGSKTSLHLSHRAADFRVDGVVDDVAYQEIKSNVLSIFSSGYTYEVIWHGTYTSTTGAHLHVGRIGADPIGTVKFIKEGVLSAKKGDYDTEIKIPIVNQYYGKFMEIVESIK